MAKLGTSNIWQEIRNVSAKKRPLAEGLRRSGDRLDPEPPAIRPEDAPLGSPRAAALVTETLD